MSPEQMFAHAVAVLPGPVRERLDGDFPIDWTILEDAGTGTGLGEAVRARRRLPEPVETLVHRLIRDVGIVPADVAAGRERQGAADAWIDWITIESHAESYHLRNDRTGELHSGIHPEAVAGYATLGMELAAALHDTAERWLEAGEHHRETAENERTPLAQCAVRMRAHLRAPSGTAPGLRTTATLARTLERAWNTQSVDVREALSGIRLSTARGARAPRRNHFAPVTGFRLHACDAGEARWLRALAERAAAGSRAGVAAPGPEAPAPHPQAGEPAAGDASSPAATATLELGTAPDALVPDSEVAELERAVSQVPGAVGGRMGEVHGAGVARALERFRDPRALDALRKDIGPPAPGGTARAPRWLEKLAATLLTGAGAQNRQGLRTASMRLDQRPQPDGEYRGIESGTSAVGHLTAVGLVEQVRLGLTFAQDAWRGLTALQNAGKEGNWVLNEARTAGSRLSAGDREMLEAARDIGRALERIRRSHAGVHGEGPPSALERAAMAAQALESVGPTVRTTAGWPGAAHAPDARAPADVARIADIAEGLHAEIRRVANRLIAGWVAEAPPYGANQDA